MMHYLVVPFKKLHPLMVQPLMEMHTFIKLHSIKYSLVQRPLREQQSSLTVHSGNLRPSVVLHLMNQYVSLMLRLMEDQFLILQFLRKEHTSLLLRLMDG
jgi:hypothetical protein